MSPTPTEVETRRLFAELQSGDRIEVEHEVKVGLSRWQTKTSGTVVKKERRRHGLHRRRAVDDKVFSDLIVLRLDSGELTTLSVDEYTVIKRL